MNKRDFYNRNGFCKLAVLALAVQQFSLHNGHSREHIAGIDRIFSEWCDAHPSPSLRLPLSRACHTGRRPSRAGRRASDTISCGRRQPELVRHVPSRSRRVLPLTPRSSPPTRRNSRHALVGGLGARDGHVAQLGVERVPVAGGRRRTRAAAAGNLMQTAAAA